jgi:hypothetical protein
MKVEHMYLSHTCTSISDRFTGAAEDSTTIRTNIVTPDGVQFYLSKELTYWLWHVRKYNISKIKVGIVSVV